MRLTTNESERFSVCANRSQSQMCRATASAPVSLSPALRAAPSRWAGADDTRIASGSRSHRMGLTTTKSERFSACANRSQSHMCRATASAPVSLSPALRAAPSRWEGADDMRMRLCSTCVRFYGRRNFFSQAVLPQKRYDKGKVHVVKRGVRRWGISIS